jgi:DNA-binding GntR family transcriptional regulator
MPKIFKKQERTTLKSMALSQIKGAIRSNKLKAGDRIVEARLAEEMGISKFPIREAIRYLEREGLVITIPFKGTYVSNFSEKDIEEIYSLRSALEELAIRIVMSELDKEKIAKLDSILGEMGKAASEGKADKVILEDMRFHRVICELSGHRKLLEMWLTLEDQIRSFIAREEYFYGQSNQLVETHYPLLEAIKWGDSQLAEKCIRDHLKNAAEIVREARSKASESNGESH